MFSSSSRAPDSKQHQHKTKLPTLRPQYPNLHHHLHLHLNLHLQNLVRELHRSHMFCFNNTHHFLLAFGPSLCVYHAGTGRTAFLACLKVSTLFILAFFGFLVTPNYFEKEGLSLNVVRCKIAHFHCVQLACPLFSHHTPFTEFRSPRVS